MRARKPNDRSWTEHYQYLVAVASSGCCPDRFVLQYICEGASPDVKRAMQTRLDRRRTDYLKQAWEMADFASTFEQDAGAHVVSGGRQSTHGRSYVRGTDVAANALIARDEKGAGDVTSLAIPRESAKLKQVVNRLHML